MSEVKEINLRIANLAPIQLKVSSDDELSWRKAADSINNLWKTWSLRFPDRSPQDILGMMTLRFAQAFEVSNIQLEEAKKAFDQIEQTLDTLLVDDLSEN
ncbi:MAG: cell division protein ZapA [Bacteroides sp.]|nr:cell division protein ZapA [Bacteroidales bacterium]MBD5378525.1 cell division protein ZapA [Bacteroides sp.]MDE5810191.1 cell division protein ZapA [Muribaculaceae bacterium]